MSYLLINCDFLKRIDDRLSMAGFPTEVTLIVFGGISSRVQQISAEWFENIETRFGIFDLVTAPIPPGIVMQQCQKLIVGTAITGAEFKSQVKEGLKVLKKIIQAGQAGMAGMNALGNVDVRNQTMAVSLTEKDIYFLACCCEFADILIEIFTNMRNFYATSTEGVSPLVDASGNSANTKDAFLEQVDGFLALATNMRAVSQTIIEQKLVDRATAAKATRAGNVSARVA